MPDRASDTAAPAAQALALEAQRTRAEATRRVEVAVQEGLERVRLQSQAYADNAGQRIDEAGRYVADQVRARPLTATGAAVGVGVLIGLLLAAGRR